MKYSTRALGDWGEQVAQRYFERRGFRLWKKNVRFREGEIDLVMMKGNTLMCVEVKLRRGNIAGWPEESLTYHKRRRLYFLALQVARMFPRWYVVRIDALSILYDGAGRNIRLRHHPHLRII
ncbi:MAG: hypothetical protein A3B74_05340 [Candidatus Kerfeldbacteria bacterium RIFCSPHIGHO2_02_FULL_42_14]|uniref:UPF0102 protein A3B74_05340 n=1 Tax=Candidatus Kerfeldbacteria bacterium RIFCSPHIGHO2_02_FULL_42_14 TaxID=1798540 RepID=A0A1G2ATQ3_9BACT|nr:MAG: hypothetical protein A3B74_05340 [Candidatus Kerfeldbacteria bacterium RIFCSPHIGHO2_02_FULL_42_14]OGY81586.1 MAG: hypothetical protein A3E60_01900 [Candidatus Kerfeldbacteria bacterium RIFCSPHIGHO2_12_FULL_42_13]OGY83187.1 MAG: hypothetical protein A3I91_03315 [Candidatus Kerfeldbacteria bacterium RIFCSPLOWO2_02_FULL_42_19]OGY86260.1 MAG: hypothetical protein A3G01_00305 [Candidatus Kerfeldbacteria bacterium RIFCSPLOWO2_12_FULL_43_9]